MVSSSSPEPVETLIETRRDDTFGLEWQLYLRRIHDFERPMDVPVIRVTGAGGAGHGVFDLDQAVLAKNLGSGVGEIRPGLLAAFYVMPKGADSRAELVCLDGSVVPGHVVSLDDRAVDIYVCFFDRPATSVRLLIDGTVIEQPIDTTGLVMHGECRILESGEPLRHQ
ncbi:MAG: hypothetical protein ACR2QO_13475 [Acidimicrobiales bacterium]